MLHPVVYLFVRQRLQVSPQDLEAGHLVTVSIHVVHVVGPEGGLAHVVRLESSCDDLPQNHARVHGGADTAGFADVESDVYEMAFEDFRSRYRLKGTWVFTYLVK